MIVFYTMAYNAGATLPRTIKSVLAQTEKEWIWYLLDNAAQDSTGEIIRRYAGMDSRIIPLKMKRIWFIQKKRAFSIWRESIRTPIGFAFWMQTMNILLIF